MIPVRIMFTKGKNPFSKLIMWGLDEPISHVAICFFDAFVVHSNIKGLNITSLDAFREHSNIVFEHEIARYSRSQTVMKMRELGKDIDRAGYDWKYFCFLFWEALKSKIMRRELKINGVHHDKNKYLCLEVAEKYLNMHVRYDKDLYATPMKMYELIKKEESPSGNFSET